MSQTSAATEPSSLATDVGYQCEHRLDKLKLENGKVLHNVVVSVWVCGPLAAQIAQRLHSPTSKKSSLNTIKSIEIPGGMESRKFDENDEINTLIQDSPIAWVCSGVTAPANAASWWPNMIGNGRVFDTASTTVISTNWLGSCFGTSNALNLKNPDTGNMYGKCFPEVTMRDQAHVLDAIRKHLHILRLDVLVGISFGGSVALEWCLIQDPLNKPSKFQALTDGLVLIGATHATPPNHKALNEIQRMAIELDPTWGTLSPSAAKQGLSIARSLATVAHRGAAALDSQQMDEPNNWPDTRNSRCASYLRHTTNKFLQKFDAYAWWNLMQCGESHDVCRGREGSVETILGTAKCARCAVIGFDSDTFRTVEEHRALANHLPNAQLHIFPSDVGHDAVVKDWPNMSTAISQTLSSNRAINTKFILVEGNQASSLPNTSQFQFF